MTLKKLFFWFWSTLFIGIVLSLFLGEFINRSVGKKLFGPLLKDVLSGSTFAAVSQLGFFSYLVFNWLSNGFVRNRFLYQVIQVFFILIVIGNLLYLNISKFTGVSLWLHLLIPFSILAVALVVAWVKVRWTNQTAWVPTIFFMVIATTLEMIPSINLKAGEVGIPFVLFTVTILLTCNAWQILQLHRWVQRSNKKS
jgi:KinB signaling pathway activation protein